MLKISMVFLVLAGCGGLAPDRPVVKTCTIEELGEVKAEFDVRCGAVRENVKRARQVMERRLGERMDSDLFQVLFHTLNLTIRDRDVLTEAGDEQIVGAYGYGWGVSAGWIEINRTMKGQLHELYHAYQASLADPDPSTSWHAGWEERGWFADDTEYNGLRIRDLSDPAWSEN